MVLLISGMITGSILARFEEAFLGTDSFFHSHAHRYGGNAGSQSSTLIIRGMAVNEMSMKDIGTVVWKEIRVALIVGFILSSSPL